MSDTLIFFHNITDFTYNVDNVSVRILLALIVGVLIGINNETHSQAINIRTHVLIALGSAIFMITSTWIYEIYGEKADPSRIGAQVVSGIGFLGAGAIIKYGTGVRGLTTAASIFITAALGLAAGAGYVWLSIFGSISVFLIVFFLLRFERNFFNYYQLFVLTISTDIELNDLFIDALFKDYSIYLKSREIDFNKTNSTYEYLFLVSLAKDFKYQEFHRKMESFPNVFSYSIKQ